MTDLPWAFNLWTEPWIRVTRHDGTSDELSIRACLDEAHTLAALFDPSPLVVAGVHRLLTAILQAIYAPQSLDDLVALLAASCFDTERLDAFAARYANRFDLFDPTAPFLQTGDMPLDGTNTPALNDAKPVSYLFPEIPAATNRSHFHHVTDETYQVCPSCCVRGLVTIAPFASAAGRPYHPSINGVPPIYVLPAGSSLFESLALSLTATGYQPPTADPHRAEIAAWNGATTIGKSTQVSAVGYIESLTFPARRMRLYPQRTATSCTQCGTPTTVIVGTLLFEMGHWLSEGSGVWEDPFAAFRKPQSRGKGDTGGLKPVRPEAGKSLWREYSGLLLAERDEHLRPRVIQQIAKLIERGALKEAQSLHFRCIGLRTDKAKIFEWLDESLEAPPSILNDFDASYRVEQALKQAGEAEYILTFSFNSHFRPERDRGGRDEKLARFRTICARMQASYWQRLAPHFRTLVFSLVDEQARDEVARGWVDTLIRLGMQIFNEAIDQVGSRADALKARVEAQALCYRRLATKRKEWFSEQ